MGPGYGFFLGDVFFSFGRSWAALWIVQAVLHTHSTLLVYLPAKRIFTPPLPTRALLAAACL
jgi:hypothetical protein